jgi:hypothetical protein
VLIQSQQPSYELRHNQFESIFLSAISYGSHFSPEVLQVNKEENKFLYLTQKIDTMSEVEGFRERITDN